MFPFSVIVRGLSRLALYYRPKQFVDDSGNTMVDSSGNNIVFLIRR